MLVRSIIFIFQPFLQLPPFPNLVWRNLSGSFPGSTQVMAVEEADVREVTVVGRVGGPGHSWMTAVDAVSERCLGSIRSYQCGVCLPRCVPLVTSESSDRPTRAGTTCPFPPQLRV